MLQIPAYNILRRLFQHNLGQSHDHSLTNSLRPVRPTVIFLPLVAVQGHYSCQLKLLLTAQQNIKLQTLNEPLKIF